MQTLMHVTTIVKLHKVLYVCIKYFSLTLKSNLLLTVELVKYSRFLVNKDLQNPQHV